MISQTAEYGLRAAVYLARHRGSPKTNTEIAEATRIPAGYLAKLLQAMGRHGLVEGRRGLGGGFQLARDPDTVTILEVFAAVDSPLQRIEKCPLGLRTHKELCPVHRLVDEALAHVERAFAAANLGELLRSTESVPPLCEVEECPRVAKGRSTQPASPRK